LSAFNEFEYVIFCVYLTQNFDKIIILTWNTGFQNYRVYELYYCIWLKLVF